MVNHRLRTLGGIAYWTVLIFFCVFWLFGISVAVPILSMSARGRIDGGLLINAAVSIVVFAWLTCVTGVVVAFWQLRRVRRPVQAWQLALMPRPSDPAEASVWWSLRTATAAWLVLMALITVALLLGF